MATLPPAAHAKAIAYTQGGHWLLLWGLLVSVLASWLILKSGVLVRLRDRIARDHPRPKTIAFAVALVFTLADALLELPWQAYAGWWREKSYDLTSQPFPGWLGEGLMDIAISAVIAALFFLALYTLIRRSPRRWWIWSGAVAAVGFVFVILVSPVLIEPLFNTYTPAPPGPVRDQVVALAEATGVPSNKIFIYNGSKQSDRYTANVSGLFGSARVAMSDVMFRQNADLAEVRGVVGHEMGHYVRGHSLWFALIYSVIAIVGFWLVARLFPLVLGWTGEAARIGGIGDPAGLPVVAMILATLGLLATPLFSTITRVAESDADAFSLRHAHEPDGLSKALVKTIAYRASSPSEVEEFIFYDHPSVERRVRRAMDWKAAHPDRIGSPAD